jgi:hypothetical protein
MGVGVFARLQHTPGIRQWDPESENWVPICVLQYGTRIRDWSRSSGDSYLEMGGVCLALVGLLTVVAGLILLEAPSLVIHTPKGRTAHE